MSEGEVIPIIPVPKARKANASVWRDIGVAETDHVLRLSSVDDIKALLMETFRMIEDSNGRYLIVLDMFYYAVQFSKENSFNSEKTSCILSILKQTHEMATETPFGNIRETLEFFKDLIICHSVHRPPFSLGIFSPQEASAISNYFIDSYFRHFKLYKYIFTPQVHLDLTIGYTKFPKTPRDSTSNDSKSTLNEDQNSARTTDEEVSHKASEAEADNTQPPEEQPKTAQIDNQLEPIDESNEQFDPRAESIGQLKRLIRERLTAEMQQVQASITAQLHQSDEAIGKLASDATTDASKKQAAKKKK